MCPIELYPTFFWCIAMPSKLKVFQEITDPMKCIKSGETGHKGGILLPEKADEFGELVGGKWKLY